MFYTVSSIYIGTVSTNEVQHQLTPIPHNIGDSDEPTGGSLVCEQQHLMPGPPHGHQQRGSIPVGLGLQILVHVIPDPVYDLSKMKYTNLRVSELKDLITTSSINQPRE